MISVDSRRQLSWFSILLVVCLGILGALSLDTISVVFGILLGLLITDTLLSDAIRALLGTLPRPPRMQNAITDVHGFQYGMDHSLLNIPRPTTLWLNMGYWENTTEFVEACKALAKMVADGARLEAGSRVLDFGYGCGDQDLFFLAAHPKCTIVGVTSETVQAMIAHDRVMQARLQDKITHYVGDAVNPSTWKHIASGQPPTVDTLNPGTYDAVISLDSCYHYRTRKRWLELSASLLRRGGRLSCTDVILGDGVHRGGLSGVTMDSIFRAVLLLTSVPFDNMVSEADYHTQLLDAGFKDVTIRDISDHVFPGLAAFIKEHRNNIGGVVDVDRKWRQYEIAARLFRWLHRKRLIRFVLTSAMRI